MLLPATETRCARLDETRAHECLSRFLPAERATPQYRCSIAHCEFVLRWKFSGFDNAKCLSQCDLFLRPLRIHVGWPKHRRNFVSAPKFAKNWSGRGEKNVPKRLKLAVATHSGSSYT